MSYTPRPLLTALTLFLLAPPIAFAVDDACNLEKIEKELNAAYDSNLSRECPLASRSLYEPKVQVKVRKRKGETEENVACACAPRYEDNYRTITHLELMKEFCAATSEMAKVSACNERECFQLQAASLIKIDQINKKIIENGRGGSSLGQSCVAELGNSQKRTIGHVDAVSEKLEREPGRQQYYLGLPRLFQQ